MADKQDIVRSAIRIWSIGSSSVCVDSDHACRRWEAQPQWDLYYRRGSTSYRSGHSHRHHHLFAGWPRIDRRVRCVRHRKTYPHNDDRGTSRARARHGWGGPPHFQNKGFLNWNPGVAGRDGSRTSRRPSPRWSSVWAACCGYEASLRKPFTGFSSDPTPYGHPDGCWRRFGRGDPHGIDTTLIQQRMTFCAPTRWSASWSLTDENDCSIIDAGQKLLRDRPPSDSRQEHPHPWHLGVSHQPRTIDAASAVCRRFLQVAPKETDPSARSVGGSNRRSRELRCFHHAWRSRGNGTDCLRSSRYIDGFTKPSMFRWTGKMVHPLLCHSGESSEGSRDLRS